MAADHGDRREDSIMARLLIVISIAIAVALSLPLAACDPGGGGRRDVNPD